MLLPAPVHSRCWFVEPLQSILYSFNHVNASIAKLRTASGTCGESANAEMQCILSPECAAAIAVDDTEADDPLGRISQ